MSQAPGPMLADDELRRAPVKIGHRRHWLLLYPTRGGDLERVFGEYKELGREVGEKQDEKSAGVDSPEPACQLASNGKPFAAMVLD